MTERIETHDELDTLLHQAVRELVNAPQSPEGTWSKLHKRIEHERTTPPDRSAPADSCVAMEHASVLRL